MSLLLLLDFDREVDLPHADVFLRLLGRASVHAPAAPAAVEKLPGQPKRFAVLAWLTVALPRGSRQRDALLPLFWPELDQSRARRALRKTIYHLRQALPAGALEGKGAEEIGVDRGLVGSDVVEFDELLDAGREEAAFGLYRGPLLAGFHLPSCPLFERWLDTERARLSRRAALAAWVLAEQALEGGADELEPRVARAIALHPLDEAGVRRGMRLLAAQGNLGAAIDTFESFRHRLEVEHGAAPAPETADLVEAIRSGRVTSTAATPPARATSPTPPSTPVPASIAVLPFSDLSPGSDLTWFGDGLAEEIINRLVQAGGLRVAARTSSFAFREEMKEVREIGRRLGVDAILEGSVRAIGDRFRVTTQLVRVGDGFHLWSQTTDVSADDLFTVQDEIALQVTRRVLDGVPGVDAELRALPPRAPVAPEAYHEYLLGRYQLGRRTPAALERAAAHLRRAVDRAPDLASAHAALAECYSILPVYTDFPSADAMPLARAAADRALALDGELADALGARAYATLVYDWDWRAAEAAWTEALALDPGGARLRALYALYLLTCSGRHAEAVAEVERARADDPLSLATIAYSGFVHMFARDYEGGARRAGEAVEIDDAFALGHWVLGSTLQCAGRAAEAVSAYRRAAELTRESPLMQSQLACGLAAAGDRDGAERILAELAAGEGTGRAGEAEPPPYFVAMAQAWLNRNEEALENLRVAYRKRAVHLMFLDVDPRWGPLRDDRRYRELVLRIGLRPPPRTRPGRTP